MGLREQAQIDNRAILGDSQGFGWPIAVTAPDGKREDLLGFSNDIALMIDPDTGVAVSGRTASAVLNIAELLAAGFTTLPEGEADAGKKPWVIEFSDINGYPGKFKVADSHRDRVLGQVVCMLEAYQ